MSANTAVADNSTQLSDQQRAALRSEAVRICGPQEFFLDSVRSGQLGEIMQYLTDTSNSDPQHVLCTIEGPPGTGKTAIVLRHLGPPSSPVQQGSVWTKSVNRKTLRFAYINALNQPKEVIPTVIAGLCGTSATSLRSLATRSASQKRGVYTVAIIDEIDALFDRVMTQGAGSARANSTISGILAELTDAASAPGSMLRLLGICNRRDSDALGFPHVRISFPAYGRQELESIVTHRFQAMAPVKEGELVPRVSAPALKMLCGSTASKTGDVRAVLGLVSCLCSVTENFQYDNGVVYLGTVKEAYTAAGKQNMSQRLMSASINTRCALRALARAQGDTPRPVSTQEMGRFWSCLGSLSEALDSAVDVGLAEKVTVKSVARRNVKLAGATLGAGKNDIKYSLLIPQSQVLELTQDLA